MLLQSCIRMLYIVLCSPISVNHNTTLDWRGNILQNQEKYKDVEGNVYIAIASGNADAIYMHTHYSFYSSNIITIVIYR